MTTQHQYGRNGRAVNTNNAMQQSPQGQQSPSGVRRRYRLAVIAAIILALTPAAFGHPRVTGAVLAAAAFGYAALISARGQEGRGQVIVGGVIILIVLTAPSVASAALIAVLGSGLVAILPRLTRGLTEIRGR